MEGKLIYKQLFKSVLCSFLQISMNVIQPTLSICTTAHKYVTTQRAVTSVCVWMAMSWMRMAETVVVSEVEHYMDI